MEAQTQTLQANSTSKRVTWIDFAKGITIILTIIGHTVKTGTYGAALRGVIFSFHMPLFFILSCVTCRYSHDFDEFKANTKKAAKHLLIPALIIFCIITIWRCQQNMSLISQSKFWQTRLSTLFFASGADFTIMGYHIERLGVSWFFFALFIGRTLFDCVHMILKDDKKLLFASCSIGILGILLSKLQWFPFSIDIALAFFPFLFLGYYIKNHPIGKSPIKLGILWFAIWTGTFLITYITQNSYLELAVRCYVLFPLCYLTAIAGTMFMCYGSLIASRAKVIATPVVFVGKNSLYLLAIHAIDRIYEGLWLVDNQWISTLKRTILDLAVFFVLMLFLKILKSILHKNKNA